jgi:hypothetical protein
VTYASPSRAKAHLKSIETILDSAKGDEALFEAIVNAPFNDKATATLLGLGILVLLLVNNKTKTIDRIALSRTGPAEGAVEMSPKPFKAIKIPVNHADNIIAKAIKSGQYQATSDWQYLFVPDLTPPQARFNQAGAGIACSVVYPLKARAGGALIFSYYIYPDQISRSHQAFMHRYAEAVAARLGDLVPNHA